MQQQKTELRLLHPSVEILSGDIAAVNTTTAYLLVQAGDEFIGFTSFHPAEKIVHGWVLYPREQQSAGFKEKFNSIAAAQPWITNTYAKVIFLQQNARNMLIPAMLNKEEGKEKLIELSIGKRPDEIHIKDIIVQHSAVNHYAVDAELAATLNSKYPKGEWWHIQSLLLTKQAAKGIEITATIWFNELQLTVEKNGQWMLLQTYSYHTPEDVLYYILNAMEQLQLKQDDVVVILQGMIDQRSALYDVLHNYILHLQLNEELQFHFPAATEEQPLHLSASLDQILTCVS